MDNTDLPEGWSMPEDLANEISEELSKKTITPQDKLQDALVDIARDIAIIEPDPVDWGGWVMYFLDQLEEESNRRKRGFTFNSVLGTLVNDLQDRLRGK
jgi:hypothetical protein